MKSPRFFKKQIRGAYSSMIPRAAPFPFEDLHVKKKRNLLPTEGILRCAGIALFVGLMSILLATWGDPRVSPSGRAMDGERICCTMKEAVNVLQNEIK